MRLYIIRHGETKWNRETRLQGQHDIPLNENGLHLAELTGEAMKDIHFDYVFSSPLSRAYKTAELVLSGQNIPIVTDERLKEISFGQWEGFCIKDQSLFPGDFVDKFYHDPLNCPAAPEGETFRDVIERTSDFYRSLLKDPKYTDKTILISTHGAASRCLLCNFYENKTDIWRGGIPKNCAVSIIDVRNGVGTIVEKDRLYAELTDAKKGNRMKNYRAELTGVFGDPVDDNPTGVVEEAAFAEKHLNYRYLTIKVLPDDLKKAMDSVRIFGMKGINLTMPHKIKVLPYLDELSQAAEIIGAVNTVIQKNNRLLGENTDGKGFVTALKKSGETLEDKTVTILGAGGAARAIAVECALNGSSRINIINRTEEKGTELASLINEKTPAKAEFYRWDAKMPVPEGTDILINATSIGFAPDKSAKPDIDYSSISPEMCACDVVFNPAETAFLQTAAAAGAKTVTGLGMLVQQAALNFTLWTGEEAPVDVMEEALRKEFE